MLLAEGNFAIQNEQLLGHSQHLPRGLGEFVRVTGNLGGCARVRVATECLGLHAGPDGGQIGGLPGQPLTLDKADMGPRHVSRPACRSGLVERSRRRRDFRCSAA